MALTKQQRMAMIDFLVPLLNDEGKRHMHIELLFAGENKRPDLNLHGGPRETTTRIVLALEKYQSEPGKPALVDLLEQASREVGFEYQAQIEEWKTALLMPVSPPPASPPVLAMPNIIGTKPAAPDLAASSPAVHSRAESFAIPAPFAWITIPADKVILEAKNESYLKKETTFAVPEFGIGKYPITTSQYTKFIEAGGYETKECWTKKGWKSLLLDRAKIQERKKTLIVISELRPEHPVSATWYEAMAFCAWLRHTINELIYLPTEQQWQRAAQGDDGRLYPWGNEWDKTHCNNNIDPLDREDIYTNVYEYEGPGDSPYGVVDMVGNAAEWCVTSWRSGEQGGDGEEERVVRGGSYTNQHLNFYRVTTRHKEWPTAHCGFRIVQLLD